MSKTQGVWIHASNGPTGSGEVTVYVEEIDALRAYAAEGVGKVVFVPYGETLYL